MGTFRSRLLQNKEMFDEIRKKEEMHRDKLIAELRVKRDVAYHKTMGKLKKAIAD